MANHFLNACRSSASKFKSLRVQLIGTISVKNDDDYDKVLWEREKYWLAKLFTLSRGLIHLNEWHTLNTRSYRK